MNECPTIITGDHFVTRVLGHIDCQAQLLGSYGYQSLGQPGSMAATVMLGLLTLFIALFGLRLLFGSALSGRDIIGDGLKIGIVLTLAFSWPAFRTMVYDVVLLGPGEVAQAIDTPGLDNDGARRIVDRLQGVDRSLVRLVEVGTGRQTGALIEGDQGSGSSFVGTALQDEGAFGYGRLFWLAGTIGSLGLIRLFAGLLLALAPLAAGLLFFDATRGVFAGWLKGLVLVTAGSIGLTIVSLVELAMLEPWLADALRIRALGYATPSAPLELLAITAAFFLVKFGVIWLLAKVAFARGWITLPSSAERTTDAAPASRGVAREQVTVLGSVVPSRAQATASSVERLMERRSDIRMLQPLHVGSGGASRNAGDSSAGSAVPVGSSAPLGSTWRRSASRISPAARTRDSK